jgi:hypothetical protein
LHKSTIRVFGLLNLQTLILTALADSATGKLSAEERGVNQVAVKQVGAGSPRPKGCCTIKDGRGNPATEPLIKCYMFDGNMV